MHKEIVSIHGFQTGGTPCLNKKKGLEYRPYNSLHVGPRRLQLYWKEESKCHANN